MTVEIPVGVYTVNGLSQRLRRDRSTITKIVADAGIEVVAKKGRSKYYRLADVVNSMFDSEELSLQQEQAKLAKARRGKVKLESEALKKSLVPANEVAEGWQKLVSAMKARLLAIPTKAAPIVFVADSQSEVKDILKKQVNDSLSELHSDLSSILN